MTTGQKHRYAGKELQRSAYLAAELERAKSALESSQLDWRSMVDRLEFLRKRLLDKRLQLAVLGQFKRGKSTFINALLGVPILPVAVVPLTAVAIFISWGPNPVARVRFKTGRPGEEFRSTEPRAIQEFLSCFVAEEQNPKNCLNVEGVELRYPSSILSNGTTLIDTPGVGSTHQHNTQAAIQILPECDAVIFIVSADPPITEIELAYLQNIRSKAARIFFVLNKLDYLEPHEQKVAIDFLRKVLSERSLLEPSTTIFGISARDALAAKQNEDREGFKRSGMARLEDALLRNLATEKGQLLEDAIRRKVGDILSQAIEKSELRIKALTLPIEELTSKARVFETALGAIDEQRRTMRDLLDGDKRRLIELLESRTHELRAEASSRCAAVAKQSLSGDSPSAWEQQARASISESLQEIFEVARERFRGEFTNETSKILALHRSRLDSLVDSVRQTAAEIFDVSFSQQSNPDSFDLGEDPYWVTENLDAALLPDPGRIIDHVVPLKRRRSRLYARIMQQADELIVRNAENLRWAILRGVDETMLQAAEYFDGQMGQAIDATKGVIEDALARRKNRSSETESEVAALDHLIRDLRGIRKTIAQGVH